MLLNVELILALIIFVPLACFAVTNSVVVAGLYWDDENLRKFLYSCKVQ